MRGTRSPGYLATSAVLGVAALTALAGCKGPSAAAAHGQKAVGKATSAAGSLPAGHSGQIKQVGPEKPGLPGGAPSTGSLPANAPGLSTCNPNELAKSFVVQGGDPGGLPTNNGMGMIVITNRSAQPCVLQGYAGLGMLATNGQHLGLQDANLSTAGGPAKVDLASGGSAFQGADFATLAACPAVADAQITPPASKTPSQVPVHFADGGSQGTSSPLRVCPGAVNMGPMSASQAKAEAAAAKHAVQAKVPTNTNLVP
jgi:hypothetical protein